MKENRSQKSRDIASVLPWIFGASVNFVRSSLLGLLALGERTLVDRIVPYRVGLIFISSEFLLCENW
jgi:hypothetical protein